MRIKALTNCSSDASVTDHWETPTKGSVFCQENNCNHDFSRIDDLTSLDLLPSFDLTQFELADQLPTASDPINPSQPSATQNKLS